MLLTDILGDKHNFFQFMLRAPFNGDNMHDQVCINGTVVVFNFKDIILFFQDAAQIIWCKEMVHLFIFRISHHQILAGNILNQIIIVSGFRIDGVLQQVFMIFIAVVFQIAYSKTVNNPSKS